jgi:hypothetical protein
VTLSAEQRTKIRETVLASGNVPRVENVNFAMSVGTTVPSSVRIVEVPETLISIHPEWRDHMYFVVRDEIVIVDHSHRIVALVPTGESFAQGSSSGQVSSSGQGSSAALNLGPDEIRRVQIMLNEKGFNVGEADGVLGARTKNALMQFQQRQGFHASGQLDQQTMAALGISGQGQPSSTGQGGGRMQQQPSAGQGSAQQPTTGQSGAAAPPANQGPTAGQQGGQPSTSGQGSNMQQPSSRPGAGQSGTSGQQNMPSNTGQQRRQ